MVQAAKPLGLMINSFLQLTSHDAVTQAGSVARALRETAERIAASGVSFVVVRDDYRMADVNSDSLPRLDPYMTAGYLSHSMGADLCFVIESDVALFEPFHIAKNLQSLDHALNGRLGWLPRIGADPDSLSKIAGVDASVLSDEREYFREFLDVVVGLWDTWEDGAIVRDAANGRYLDPAKVHFLKHEGKHFAVRGPSLCPRSPQGHIPAFTLPGDVLPSDARITAEITMTHEPHPDGSQSRELFVASLDEFSVERLDGFAGGVIDATHVDSSSLLEVIESVSGPALKGRNLRELFLLPAAPNRNSELASTGAENRG